MFARGLVQGFLSVMLALRMGSGGSVFDGPSLPMLGLDLEGASVGAFQ